MPWDLSVQALTRFPDVIQMLSDHLDWTSSLGMAFSSQPEDVANVIQMLRAKAENVGNLKSTPEQVVTSREESGSRIIYIAPANPERIYVPVYDSSAVFTSSLTGALIFGTGVLVGSTWNNRWGCGWNQIWISPPVWQPPPPNWRPPLRPGARPPGVWRPDRPGPDPIVPALGQIDLARADPTVPVQADLTAQVQVDLTGRGFAPIVQVQAGPIVRARGGLTDPRQAGLIGREIGLKVPAWAGPNVPPRVRNAQQSGLPSARNVLSRAGRPISGAVRQAPNNVGMQDHNNDPTHSRRTGRHNGNKAARDLNNAHDHSNRHVRASSTHAHDKGVVHDPNSARSAHDHSRVQHRNEPPHVRDRSGSKSRLVSRCTSRIGVELG